MTGQSEPCATYISQGIVSGKALAFVFLKIVFTCFDHSLTGLCFGINYFVSYYITKKKRSFVNYNLRCKQSHLAAQPEPMGEGTITHLALKSMP